MSSPLTDRQREVLEWIEDYITIHTWPPTRIEIADAFGWAPNAAQEHVAALQRKGWIEVAPRVARGIRLLEPAD